MSGTFCESHATDIPFQVVARLVRAGMKVDDLDDEPPARAYARWCLMPIRKTFSCLMISSESRIPTLSNLSSTRTPAGADSPR